VSYVIPDFRLELDWKETVPSFGDIATTYPNPEEGWVVSVDDENILYRYDDDTATWYPITDVQHTPFTAARDKANATNLYLANDDSLFTNLTPMILPENMNLVELVAARADTAAVAWSGEIHTNLTLVAGATVTVASGQSQNSATLNIPFNAGDGLQFYMNGVGINRPRILAFFRRRT
jgi:hypothetical protein